MKKMIAFFTFTTCLVISPADAEKLSPQLETLQTALQANPEDTQLLNDTGIALYKAGKYAEAESFFQKSLAIDEKNLGAEHPNVATDLNNLAEVYQAQAKYAQAETLIQKALAIREKAFDKNHPDIGQSLNNLAMLYQAQGKYAQAEPLLQRSLAIDEQSLGKEHPDVASDLNNLAGLYATQKKYPQAESLYLRCLAIDEKALGQEHPDFASDLNNLAGVYLSEKKYSQAESLYLRSLTIREKVLGKNHPAVAVSLNNLAELYRTQEKYKQAEGFYQRSLAIKEISLGSEHPSFATSLDNLAMLYAMQNKFQQAEPLFEKSLQIVNQSLDRWLWGAGEKTRQSYLQRQESRRNYYLSLYSFRNRPQQAFDFSLRRKGVLLQIASEINSLAKQSSDPIIQQQTQEFSSLKTQLSALVLSGKQQKLEISALEEKINQLEMQLSQKVSGFRRSKTPVTAMQVLEKLDSTKALIDFLIYTEVDLKNQKNKTEQVIALLVDKKSGIKLIKLGELAAINQVIKTYRQNVLPTPTGQLPSRKEILNPASQQLYQLIWQPLSAYLANKTEIYLIPDGILHLLPFKALQDKQGHYLAETKQLTMLTSARDIVLPPLTEKANDAVIFAAPAYGQMPPKTASVAIATIGIRQQDIYFEPLEGAAAEGKALTELIKTKQPVQFFQNDQASEIAVESLKSPRFLHFATHGFFLENLAPLGVINERSANIQDLATASEKPSDNPLTRSGLALTGANLGITGKKQADGTDGILTALEVLALNLSGTDLVTLSACETGVGDIQIGEGVYSLNRAFQEAGAKSVLSTLWSVADEQTMIFMQHFYTLILKGNSPQQALQKTQLKFINDKAIQDPFFWAAFTVVGI